MATVRIYIVRYMRIDQDCAYILGAMSAKQAREQALACWARRHKKDGQTCPRIKVEALDNRGGLIALDEWRLRSIAKIVDPSQKVLAFPAKGC